jgi:hypothetical protein
LQKIRRTRKIIKAGITKKSTSTDSYHDHIENVLDVTIDDLIDVAIDGPSANESSSLASVLLREQRVPILLKKAAEFQSVQFIPCKM